jgi:hypothetical protein
MDQIAAAPFIVYTSGDGASVQSVVPMVRFTGGTKCNQALITANGYIDEVDTELGWLTAPHGIATRKAVRFTPGSNSGLPAPNLSLAMTKKLPYGCHVVRVRVIKNADATGNTQTDWSIDIKDGASTSILPSGPITSGSYGVPAATQWKAGFKAYVDDMTWICTSANNRTLTATITGTSANNDTAGLLEIEYIG